MTDDEEFKKAVEHALNETYPGTAIRIRDTNLSPDIIKQYKPGDIILELDYAEGSSFSKGGMRTNARYMILSSHMISLDELIEHNNTLVNLGPKGCGLYIARRNGHFRVLDVYEYKEKTLITLLHLPDDETWKLFRNLDNWQGTDGEFVEICRKAFEERCELPPRPELDTPEVLGRWDYPLGFNGDGELNEADPDAKTKKLLHFRYLLEHRVLPQAVLLNTEKTLAALTFEKEMFLKKIADGIAEKTGETNPYTEEDFRVHPMNASNHKCIMILMPEAVKELQCKRIYVMFDIEEKKPVHVRYFTVEKNEQRKNDDKARDFLCEWTVEGKHRNHGTVECIEDEALCMEALCGEFDLRRDFEINILYMMFCEKTEGIFNQLKKRQGTFIAGGYAHYAKELKLDNPYSDDDYKVGFFETKTFTGCRVRMPEPVRFLQCSRVYFVSKKDYTVPLYFMVQKRGAEGSMDEENPKYTDVMVCRNGDDIICLGCVESIEDDIRRIRMLLNE